MRATRACLVLIALVAVSVLVAAPGRAEHVKDHRYFIVGKITNEFGEALCGVTVRAADVTKPTAENNRTAKTDGSGNFAIQLHMHDSFDIENNVARPVHNVGDEILVIVEGTRASRSVNAVQNSINPLGWGQQNGDLQAEGLQSQCLSGGQIALAAGGIVGAFVAVYGVAWLLRTGRFGRGTRSGLSELPGMSRVQSRELEGFGIRSVKDLAAAKPEELAAGTTLTPKQARLLVKRANEALVENT